jgi:hypothetical protein
MLWLAGDTRVLKRHIEMQKRGWEIKKAKSKKASAARFRSHDSARATARQADTHKGRQVETTQAACRWVRYSGPNFA